MTSPKPGGKPSSLVDTRVVYCGDCLEKLRDLPDACVDLIYIDPPFNSNRNYEVGTQPERPKGELDLVGEWYPVQVKQKDKVGRPDVDAFEAVMEREDRRKGFFVGFAYTADATTEISRYFKQSGRVIIPLTVKDILEEELASKLA